MTDLQIALNGTVTASNFNEWKSTLLAQLDEANRELQTDDDFAHAAVLIKSFKTAEDSLKKAKQDALNQVSDIQSLFAAIDEVVDRTRNTRLALNKQVTSRKKEIQSEIVEAGKARIRESINAQPEYFQHQDHTSYLDNKRFEEATKRKTTTDKLRASIDQLCTAIEAEIKTASATVQANKHRIESLPPADRELFPDLHDLIAQQPETVEEVIQQRTTNRSQRIAARHEEPEPQGEVVLEQPGTNAAGQTGALALDTEKFRITLDFSSDETSAKAFASQLGSTVFDNIALSNLRLERRPISSWDEAIEFADPAFRDLLKIYRQQQHEVPQVGFEVSDSKGKVSDLVLPLAWPERKFSVVKNDAQRKRAMELGWDAMLLDEAMRETMQDG